MTAWLALGAMWFGAMVAHRIDTGIQARGAAAAPA
jgi:hypothetical protein